MSSLYDVRVSMHEGSTSSSSKLASELLAEREEQEAASTEQADHIDFSAGISLGIQLCRANVWLLDFRQCNTEPLFAGNPRVEHLTGTVHLYRQVPSRADAESHRPDALPVGQPLSCCITAARLCLRACLKGLFVACLTWTRSVPAQQSGDDWPRNPRADPMLPDNLQEGRSERLCVLALPLGMSVSDFCAFVGGYLPSVREMRLVRRSDESSACLVLLRFKDRPTADLFYSDFNNRAVRFACWGACNLDNIALHSGRAGCFAPYGTVTVLCCCVGQ